MAERRRERERCVEEHRPERTRGEQLRGGGGVIANRRISHRLKGKVMSTCVTPACLYGTEALEMTELQRRLCSTRKL